MQINNMVLWYRPDTIRLDGSQAVGYNDASPAGNHSRNAISPQGFVNTGSYTANGNTFAETVIANQLEYQMRTGLTLGDEYTIIVAGCPRRGSQYPWSAHISGTEGTETSPVGLGFTYSGANSLRVQSQVHWGAGKSRLISSSNNSPNMFLHGVIKSNCDLTYRTPQTGVMSSSASVPSTYTGWGEVVLGHAMDAFGSATGFPGILEVVIFDRALSQEEIEYVEGYLAWKYNSRLLLNSTHPYRTVAPVGTLEAGTSDSGGTGTSGSYVNWVLDDNYVAQSNGGVLPSETRDSGQSVLEAYGQDEFTGDFEVTFTFDKPLHPGYLEGARFGVITKQNPFLFDGLVDIGKGSTVMGLSGNSFAAVITNSQYDQNSDDIVLPESGNSLTVKRVGSVLTIEFNGEVLRTRNDSTETLVPVFSLVAGDTVGLASSYTGSEPFRTAVGHISKGSSSIARRQVMSMTMSKAAMETASGVPQAEWKRVLALYTSEGNPKAVVSFKHSQQSAPGRFRSKAESSASYTLSKVIIVKTDSTYKIVDRSEFDCPELLDVEVT